MLRSRPRAAASALALTIAAALPAAVAANSGAPNVHTPALYEDPPEFGGLFNLTVGNSDSETVVTACISSRCRRIYPVVDNGYNATGSLFGLRFERGQERTVKVTASNADATTVWGPSKVTVR